MESRTDLSGPGAGGWAVAVQWMWSVGQVSEKVLEICCTAFCLQLQLIVPKNLRGWVSCYVLLTTIRKFAQWMDRSNKHQL